ncbi:MAG: M12 family metallo-peptidase [Lysobacteraceae bacterium]
MKSSAIGRALRCIGFLLLVSAAALATAKDDRQPVLSLSAQAVAAMTGLTPGKASVTVQQKTNASPWRFHAIRLQSGEQTLSDDPEGHLAKRRFLISERGAQQIALAFEADGGFAFGFLDDENGLQRLIGDETSGGGLRFSAVAIEQQPVNCEADRVEHAALRSLKLPQTAASRLVAKGGVPGHEAKVAIEVDFAMMSGHFGNSTANALSWLQQMFLATNLYYQRDLALQLVMATPVIYNTSTDPYCTTGNPCSPLGPHLMFQFGDYWRNNHSGIDRDFAALISGRLTGGNPTGISWTNQYCKNGFDTGTPWGTKTAGSYGVNLYVPGASVSGGAAAELFGHELGHSLGAEHNNCTDTNPGMGGLQPIDQCSNSANSLGAACWGGSLACPVSGSGLIMSTGCADIAGCSLNRQRVFHPVQIDLLTGNIASNTPSCLSTTILPGTDVLYYDGFE